ncbi:MAG TPA: NBR1-Ig-like domain-containing protein [Anaerolineales bacterium]
MKPAKRLPIRFSLLTTIVWLLAAGGSIFLLWELINLISAGNIPISTATPNQTQVYQTIAAFLTPQGTRPSATVTPKVTPVPTLKPTQGTSQTLLTQDNRATTPANTQSATPTVPCDRAGAGNPIDITIPDDSLIEPGQSFVKTWKLINNGTCTWTASYSASFFYGDRMQAPKSVALDETVLPAQSVEISIDMVAPEVAGNYQANWKLSNASGVLFGIGPNGDSPFWVRIIVPANPSNTATGTQGITDTPGASPTQGTPATASPTGSPTSTSTPPIQASGELTLTPGDSIDLDTIVISDQNDDLKYQVDANNYHWLAPEDGARIGVYGSQQPGLVDCQSASMSQAPIAVESLSAGTYLCYLTGEGLYGRALFIALESGNYTLTLDLLTWRRP